MEFLKGIAGKVIGGAVALGVIILAVAWWRADETTHRAVLSSTGKIAAWFGVVLALPWASFFVIGRVARLESNTAGAALVAAYTVVEVILLAWLFHWTIAGATPWTFAAVGGLFAAAYNLFACDWIAEKTE
jgi:hypothetical protein